MAALAAIFCIGYFPTEQTFLLIYGVYLIRGPQLRITHTI